MVDALAAVVFVAAEEEFAIEPHLPRILAAQPDLRIAGLGGVEFGVGIARHFLDRSEGLVEIDLAVIVGRRIGLPLHRLVFLARVFGVELDLGLGRKDAVETGPVGVVEGSDEVPVRKKTEVLRQIDLLRELFTQQFGDGVDLINFARGVEGGLESAEAFRLIARLELCLAFREQFRDRIAAEGGARVISESGDKGCGLFRGEFGVELEGEAARVRLVFAIEDKGFERLSGHGCLRREGPIKDRLDGGAHPVAGEGARTLHGREHWDEHLGPQSRQGIPRGGRFGVAGSFGADLAQLIQGGGPGFRLSREERNQDRKADGEKESLHRSRR